MTTRSSPKRLGIIVLVAALALVAGGLGTAYAYIPGGTLTPDLVPKYQAPMLIPPVMPKADVIKQKGGKNVDYYEISVKQFQQRILPEVQIDGTTAIPTTTVWGYGAVKASDKNMKALVNLHNAPSLTIEARWETPVRVKWINDLVVQEGPNKGNYLPHLLTVDPTLHWANPPGGNAGRDTRPFPFDPNAPAYTGPVPMVTHVHGAVGVGDESDGYAEAWYLPAANDIPAGYATEGTWYNFFKTKAQGKGFGTWGTGYAIFEYPNLNRASTIWYHDHTLGMTRLNVYAGPAGFFLLRGGPAGASKVLDSRNGNIAVLPGPAPKETDKFPFTKPYYEIPIAVQDRSFNTNGSLFYPETRQFFGDPNLPPPYADLSPYWNPEFFGNMMMVNGNTWPFQNVEQRRYRLRFLNGCQSRFLILDFTEIIQAGGEVWQIGNEGGFLEAPVNLATLGTLGGDNGPNRLLMGLAERADIIVDFTNVPQGNYILKNVGPDEPYGGGVPGNDFDVSDPDSTGQVMQFRVGPIVGTDASTPPQYLQLPPITPLPAATVTRPLALLEEVSPTYDAPKEALLGTVAGDPNTAAGMWTQRLWMDPITENPDVGATEVWEFYNATGDAHPIHVHEVVFDVVDRQPITVNEDTMEVQVVPGSVPIPPEPWESGFKDTVTAYPNQVTRIKAKFDNPGQFVWHCHIVEHEDNEMMRPYRVGPVQEGQPM